MYLAPKPIFFPLHNVSSMGKHFSGFTLYPTALLNSFITSSKLMFLDRIHTICTNSYFYFFPYISYNVTLGNILILLKFTFLIFKMGIIELKRASLVFAAWKCEANYIRSPREATNLTFEYNIFLISKNLLNIHTQNSPIQILS